MKRNIALVVMLVMAFVSCAHKSGHGQRMSSSGRAVTEASRSNHKPLTIPSSGRSGKELEGKDIFRKYTKAVFMIFTTNGEQAFQGSGFFINAHGLAVSNYHVFKGTLVGDEQIKLAGSDRAYKVREVIVKDEQNDFILFTVDVDNTVYIPIARQRPDVGERVYAIGSPRGLENTFSSGEVSQWRDRNLMQIDVQIDHGSSGGALINTYGEVVGITSGTFDAESQANLNYAWSIEVVKPYLK